MMINKALEHVIDTIKYLT